VPEDGELILSLSAEETQDTPLRELVAGFGEIAALPIPYARLPRRGEHAVRLLPQFHTLWRHHQRHRHPLAQGNHRERGDPR
jgi:hypothetical protein